MSVKQCARCGAEIEDVGVQFKGNSFCSDECCEEFSDELVENGKLDLEDIDEDFTDDEIEDIDLDGAGDVDDDDDDDFVDDDFDDDF